MNKHEQRYRKERIALHRSSLQVGLGIAETQQWSVSDALSSHSESLQQQELRHVFLSDPAALGDDACEHEVLWALKPFVVSAKGRPDRTSLTPKLDLKAATALEKLADKRRFSFPLDKLSERRWHVIRGAEVPSIAVLVGIKLKRGAEPPEGVDAVRDPKGALCAGVSLVHLGGAARAGTFEMSRLALAVSAAEKALSTKKVELYIVVGAEQVQRADGLLEGDAPAARPPVGSDDREGLPALLEHFQDVAVDIFQAPFRFGRAEREGERVSLVYTLHGEPGRVSVRWDEPLLKDREPDPSLCEELSNELTALTSDD